MRIRIRGTSGSKSKDLEGRLLTAFNFRTYFVAFACLIQLQLLFDLETPLPLPSLDSMLLPCSEEEWAAENEETWRALKFSDNSPPTPSFRDAFNNIFQEQVPERLYSEFGGYVMISAILGAILDSHRVSSLISAGIDFSKMDRALDNWHTLWHHDPKSHVTGPSSPSGSLAFNASVIYRVASVRRVVNYSRYRPLRSLT